MMPCPGCGQALAPKPVGFSWWGGLLGPKLFHHVECPGCATRYNGKTGRSNNTAIALYLIVVGLLALVAVYAIA